MARVISVTLPLWPIDRLRRSAPEGIPGSDARPLVLAARVGNRRLVTAACAVAQELGLTVGMPVSKVQAMVPDLQVLPHDPQADAASLERLALWVLQRVSPIVAVDPPDGLVIDSTGADHLHGGEEAMLETLIGRLVMSGVTARAAVADTWGAAHALARHVAVPMHVAEPGTAEALLSPLPLSALRLPPATLASLRTLGFVCIGDLLHQPRAPLTRRFGPDLCRRLDQALGHASEPIEPLRLAELVEVRRAFAEPIAAAETIARYIGKLVVQLCAALEERGLGARRLDLLCWRVDAHVQTVRVGLARPQRDPQRLTRLLCEKIETISPGYGIEILSLTAVMVEPLDARQMASSLLEAPAPDLSGLVDVLANRVGARGVYRMAPVASDVPERSVTRIAALSEPVGAGWPDHWPRPTRLLPRPEPIETLALLPDHPPVSITWRGIRRKVARADGPERVFGEWWKRDAEMIAVRDYFRIEDEAGERYWVFRAGDGEHAETGSHRWFLHGVFG
ncbi:Y-family DNA polymerase [Paracoccus aerius]|uniref:DNA-directed DNA polymerase n=1 Tax=Paracoccus aerius TaxID=1915382 RepID=A0ABS1S6Q8_9RHOB|nr:DNA polymerase Y family protein [Paracoccus aerius]MBL3674404.1 DNA polymerase Y family protein [Paracoccus aerius]GHG25355.1 nucleotidyltransferase [Paracoccus aerius]